MPGTHPAQPADHHDGKPSRKTIPGATRRSKNSDAEFLAFLRGGVAFSTLPSSGSGVQPVGFTMLGRIITQVSGMPYQQYISEKIFKPLGIKTFWEYEGLPAELLALGYRFGRRHGNWSPCCTTVPTAPWAGCDYLIGGLRQVHGFSSFSLAGARRGEEGPVKRSSLREMQQLYGARLIVDTREVPGRSCPAMVGYRLRPPRAGADYQGIVQVAGSGLPVSGATHAFFPARVRHRRYRVQ
jgi:CubicO group peptidase (beta-lactamase class C family)